MLLEAELGQLAVHVRHRRLAVGVSGDPRRSGHDLGEPAVVEDLESVSAINAALPALGGVAV
jgi:hypothetical protein